MWTDYGWPHKSRLRCQTVLLPAGSLIRFIIVECDFNVGFLVKLDVGVHVDFFHDPRFALQLALHLEFVETVTSIQATQCHHNAEMKTVACILSDVAILVYGRTEAFGFADFEI